MLQSADSDLYCYLLTHGHYKKFKSLKGLVLVSRVLGQQVSYCLIQVLLPPSLSLSHIPVKELSTEIVAK